MTDLQEKAMRMALEALVILPKHPDTTKDALGILDNAIKALRQALAQPEQNPVDKNMTLACPSYLHGYTAPPKREWVGLTDDDIAEIRRNGAHSISDKDFRAIEAKLKEKNT